MAMMVTAHRQEKSTRRTTTAAYRRPTKSVERALQRAQQHAVRQGRGLAGPHDLLAALIDDPQGLPMTLIGHMGISPQIVSAAVAEGCPADDAEVRSGPPTEEEWAASRALMLEEARFEAEDLGSNHLGTEHLLLGLLRQSGPEAGLLKGLGLTRERIVSTLEERAQSLAPPSAEPASPMPALTAVELGQSAQAV